MFMYFFQDFEMNFLWFLTVISMVFGYPVDDLQTATGFNGYGYGTY